MPRTWTTTGQEYTSPERPTPANDGRPGLEGGARCGRAIVEDAIERLRFLPYVEAFPMAMGPRLALQKLREIWRGKDCEVAVSHALAPYGLLGYRATFANAGGTRLTIYVLDRGSELVNLAVDEEPTGAAGDDWRPTYGEHQRRETATHG